MAKNTLYQLQFITSPNDGFYEATIKMKKGIPSLGGDISRIDAYGNQSYCIADKFPLLRKYCYYSIVTTTLSQMYRETTSTPGAFEREIERAVLHG